MVHVLALLAKAGHGKTTVANYLRDRYDARIVALAGPLKRAAKKLMNFSDAQLYGTQEEKEAIDPRYGFSAREFMQKLGTEALREEFGQDIHIRNLLRHVEEDDARSETTHVYVIDDCRFRNEAAFFADGDDFHGAVIKIFCEDAPEVAHSNHVSEREIDLVPPEMLAATVVGSRAKGLDDLCRQVDHTINTLPRLAPFRRVLQEGAARLSKAA